MRGTIEPSCYIHLRGQLAGASRQLGKNMLANILCEMPVSSHLTQRGGIYQWQMSFYQGMKSLLTTLIRVAPEQNYIIAHAQSFSGMYPAGAKSDTTIGSDHSSTGRWAHLTS